MSCLNPIFGQVEGHIFFCFTSRDTTFTIQHIENDLIVANQSDFVGFLYRLIRTPQ